MIAPCTLERWRWLMLGAGTVVVAQLLIAAAIAAMVRWPSRAARMAGWRSE